MRTIELAKPVDAECATCNQKVNWATHTAVECRNVLRAQRDEARHVARCYHAYGKSEILEGQYPWLKASNR